MLFFPTHIHIAVDRARRNMAHLVSGLQFSRTVYGPLSSQFCQACSFSPPFFFPVNDLTGYRLPVLTQTADSRIQGVSGIHKLVTTQ